MNVDVVLANSDRVTLRVGDTFLLDDFIAGYGEDVDREIVRAWWAWRCLVVIRWLSENGYGSPEALPETAVLRSLAG